MGVEAWGSAARFAREAKLAKTHERKTKLAVNKVARSAAAGRGPLAGGPLGRYSLGIIALPALHTAAIRPRAGRTSSERPELWYTSQVGTWVIKPGALASVVQLATITLLLPDSKTLTTASIEGAPTAPGHRCSLGAASKRGLACLCASNGRGVPTQLWTPGRSRGGVIATLNVQCRGQAARHLASRPSDTRRSRYPGDQARVRIVFICWQLSLTPPWIDEVSGLVQTLLAAAPSLAPPRCLADHRPSEIPTLVVSVEPTI